MRKRVLAFALIAILAVFTVGAAIVVEWPAGQLDPHVFAAIPFLIQLFAAAAYQLSWSIYVSDYSRYLPPDVGVRAAFWWTFAGAMIGGVWMMLVGATAAAALPGTNVIAAARAVGDLIFPGFGLVLLIVAFAGLITATSLNFYGASLTLLSITDSFVKLRNTVRERIGSLLIVTAAASLLAFSASGDFMHQYELLLSGAAVSFHALDRDQPDRFLHRPARHIFHPRHFRSRRHLRPVELARPDQLRDRLCRDGAVLLDAFVHRLCRTGDRRRRYLHAHRPSCVSDRVSLAVQGAWAGAREMTVRGASRKKVPPLEEH